MGIFLAGHLPRRLYPPGKVAAYSNYGYAIAGYLVEQVSGVPFNDYVTRNILEPLGMQSSSFDQPLPEALAANLSMGYLYTGDLLAASPFEFFQLWPAGSMSATANDTGHFVIAQLQGGNTLAAASSSLPLSRRCSACTSTQIRS